MMVQICCDILCEIFAWYLGHTRMVESYGCSTYLRYILNNFGGFSGHIFLLFATWKSICDGDLAALYLQPIHVYYYLCLWNCYFRWFSFKIILLCLCWKVHYKYVYETKPRNNKLTQIGVVLLIISILNVQISVLHLPASWPDFVIQWLYLNTWH